MAKPELEIHDQTTVLQTGRLLIVFTALSTAMLITFIDQQSIGVILPTIGESLDSSSTITWAATSSLIANTAFQVLYGRLSDIFGRKVMLVGCLFLLGLGDLLCSFAQTGSQFFAFRGVSGVATGGVQALTMMVVSDVTTLQQRGKFMGILGACVGGGNAIGPFLASALAEKVTWRALFWLLCPLAILAGVILYFLLPPQTIPDEPWTTKAKKIDYLGILFSSTGTICLLIPISGINTEWAATSPLVISMLTVGSSCLVLFILNEWKVARLPMFPLRLFKKPAMAAMMTQNFLIGAVYYSILYYLPLFYQIVRGMDSLDSALMILAVVLPQCLAAIASGQYMSRMNRYGEVIWTGFTLWVTAAIVESMFSRFFPVAGMIAVLIIQGMGVGFTFQPVLVAAQAHSSKADRAVVISSRNFLRSLGGACGLAIASAIFSNSLVDNLPAPPSLPEKAYRSIVESVFSVPDLTGLSLEEKDIVLNTYTHASRSVFYFWVGCISVCWLATFFIKDEGLQRKEEREEATTMSDNSRRGSGDDSGSTTEVDSSGGEEDLKGKGKEICDLESQK